jgi:hypothetical protein
MGVGIEDVRNIQANRLRVMRRRVSSDRGGAGQRLGVGCMVELVGFWGVASFENDAAGEWFLQVEEAPDPGAVMAFAIDEVLSAAEYLEVEVCCEAIAAAELCACCAGQLPGRLPDNVDGWVQANPHGPHADEIELMVAAVSRVREESELRDLWEAAGDCSRWLAEVDDLRWRLGRSSAGSPPSVSP